MHNRWPRIIRELRKRKFKFATVGQLIQLPGAEPGLVDSCFNSKPGDTNRYDLLSGFLHQEYENFQTRFKKRTPLPRP